MSKKKKKPAAGPFPLDQEECVTALPYDIEVCKYLRECFASKKYWTVLTFESDCLMPTLERFKALCSVKDGRLDLETPAIHALASGDVLHDRFYLCMLPKSRITAGDINMTLAPVADKRYPMPIITDEQDLIQLSVGFKNRLTNVLQQIINYGK